MQCPRCTKSTQVLDSRPDGKSVRRRRKCKACGTRFATVEKLVESLQPGRPANKPKVSKPKPQKPAAAPAPKQQQYKPPKNRGRDLDDIWDDLSDGGEGLSLRDLGLD